MIPASPKAELVLAGSATNPGPFHTGAVVLVALNNPREKFWGAILELSPAGLSIRGIDLNSFEDFAGMLHAGDPVSPNTVFFPMMRIERLEMDTRNGEIPSLSERFEVKAGRTAAAVLGGTQVHLQAGCTMAEAERQLIVATLATVGDDVSRAAKLLGIGEEQVRSVFAR